MTKLLLGWKGRVGATVCSTIQAPVHPPKTGPTQGRSVQYVRQVQSSQVHRGENVHGYEKVQCSHSSIDLDKLWLIFFIVDLSSFLSGRFIDFYFSSPPKFSSKRREILRNYSEIVSCSVIWVLLAFLKNSFDRSLRNRGRIQHVKFQADQKNSRCPGIKYTLQSFFQKFKNSRTVIGPYGAVFTCLARAKFKMAARWLYRSVTPKLAS